jgi:hypothetical protein
MHPLDRRAWLHYSGSVPYAERDTNSAQRLPSVLSADGYARIAETMAAKQAHRQQLRAQALGYTLTPPPVPEAPPPPVRRAPRPEVRRFASLGAVEGAGFRKCASGFYRDAHSIWELRPADDGSGKYDLVRKREERAVDLREAQTARTARRQAGMTRQARAPWLRRGAPCVAIRRGQLAEGIVVSVRPDDTSVEVQFADSGGGSEILPMEMVMEGPVIEPIDGEDAGGEILPGLDELDASDDAGDEPEEEESEPIEIEACGCGHPMHDFGFGNMGLGIPPAPSAPQTIIVVTTDDLGDASGGASQDPFRPEIEPESKRSPKDDDEDEDDDDD